LTLNIFFVISDSKYVVREKEVCMRKGVFLLVLSLLMALSLSLGCASRDYVRQQIDPLVDRISKLEAMDCCNKADAAAQRAEDAAQRAEKAAQRSENASQKAGKAFELQQVK
jgi:hypothetical protein